MARMNALVVGRRKEAEQSPEQLIIERSFTLPLPARKGWGELKEAFVGAGGVITPVAEKLGERTSLEAFARSVRHVVVSAAEIGFQDRHVTIEDLYKRAAQLKLEPCLPQAGWEMVISQYRSSQEVGDILVATKPIFLAYDQPLLLEIRRSLTMDVDAGGQIITFRPERQWLFQLMATIH